MPVKMVKKPAVAAVEITKGSKVHKQEQVPVAVVDVSGPTANVGFTASYTKNLGDYESVKVGVALYMPVPVSLDPGISNTAALNEAYEFVQNWVDKKLNEVLDELNE